MMIRTSKRPIKNTLALQLTWANYTLMLLMMIVTSLPAVIPENSAVMPILLVKLIPLLLVFPGLVADHLRAHIWLCFIILFYFTQAVVETFLSLAAFMDIFITSLTVVMFLSSMFYIKWERTLGRQL